MKSRIEKYYKRESRLCLIMSIFGISFISLFFSRFNVALIFVFFFQSISCIGGILLINYGWKYMSLRKKRDNIIAHLIKQPSEVAHVEQSWIDTRLKEISRNRIILTALIFIGFIAIVSGVCGVYKLFMVGTGGGILFGAALWLSAELFSELQTKEYLRQLLKNK